jgi:hypothetical protein
LPNKLRTLPHDIAIEAAAQPAIARDDEHFDLLPFALLQQGMRRPIHALTQITEHPPHLEGVGTRRQNAVLRPFQLCRGHHLHGLGNLLCIFKRRNFTA